jgi:PPM family protein phosphatase
VTNSNAAGAGAAPPRPHTQEKPAVPVVQCPHCRSRCQVFDWQTNPVPCSSCGKPFAVPSAAPAPVASSCRLDIGSATSKGRVRQRNEDCFLVQHLTWSDLDVCCETALVVVTDGLGGHEAGDRAARLVIRTVGAALAGVLVGALGGQRKDTSVAALAGFIAAAIKEANRVVHQQAKADPACKGMGATVAAVLVWNGQVLVGHVGDCRVYHLRGGRLSQVTRDQTLVNRMIELGKLTPEEARTHPSGNDVYQAVGRQFNLEPARYRLTLAAGDWLVAASDGLHAHLGAPALQEHLAKAPPSAAGLAEYLVALADKCGGSDNCTVVAARCY